MSVDAVETAGDDDASGSGDFLQYLQVSVSSRQGFMADKRLTQILSNHGRPSSAAISPWTPSSATKSSPDVLSAASQIA